MTKPPLVGKSNWRRWVAYPFLGPSSVGWWRSSRGTFPVETDKKSDATERGARDQRSTFLRSTRPTCHLISERQTRVQGLNEGKPPRAGVTPHDVAA